MCVNPRGRVVEVFGAEGAGKTTVALHAISQAQAKGLVCAFVDTECSLDIEYAQAVGVDTDTLLFSQPQSAEQALEIYRQLYRPSERHPRPQATFCRPE